MKASDRFETKVNGKSKKTEVENSLEDTEEVKIYRGKGLDNKNADATYGELIEELDSNGIRKE